MSKWLKIGFFLIIFFIFCYLRIMPIINRTVPYTYDQGRDFLKVAQIINERKLTFIGPATGIMGLFHGAWWYYILLIPYIIFNGWPTGFYIFIFLISILFNLLFFSFINKRFNFITGLFFMSIVSISQYFVPLSFFVSNNIIVPSLIIGLIILTFYLFDNKNINKYLLLLLGLNLGFIFEFEVAFGLFIIPIYLLLLVIFPSTKSKLFYLKNWVFLLIGLAIPFIPRALFEIKNHFLQTKTIINFFINPKLHNPRPLLITISDRLTLFWNYYLSIFNDKNIYFSIITGVLTIIVLLIFRKKLVKIKALFFLMFVTVLLFLFSILYKDNFWTNYYEGIQYVILTFILVGFYLLSKYNKILSILVFLIFFIFNILVLFNTLKNTPVEIIGLKEAEVTIDYLSAQVNKKDYCLKIYTPPAIPFTYNYLINYQIKKTGLKYPSNDFISNQCYYIVENDSYQFRLNKWREENIPKNSRLELRHKISNNVSFEIWKQI